MALLFMESFDHVDDGFELLKWDNAYSTGHIYCADGYGSDGGFGIYTSNYNGAYLGKLLPATYATIIFGCRFKIEALADAAQFLMFLEGGTNQIEVRALTDGSIGVYRGTTLIAQSSSGLVSPATWFYFEIKLTISETVGSVQVRVNETEIINETSLDTCSTGNEYIDQFRLYSNGSTISPDDLYVLDNSGTVRNDFLGAVRVKAYYPVSDGTYSDFTPSTGVDNYATVDDPQLVGSSDYNESSTVGHKDTYNMGQFNESGAIFGIQMVAAVQNGDAGAITARTICRSGATPADNEGADHTLSQTITAAITVYEQEPTDAVDWTAAKFNAAEFGLKVQS